MRFTIITIVATIVVVIAVVYECIMLWKEINK
nr:MAG TPA: hypothetical protein [Caudoviricetes sp.]